MTSDHTGKKPADTPAASPESKLTTSRKDSTPQPSREALALVRSLIERLYADAETDRPLLRGIVSSAERNALRELFQSWEDTAALPSVPKEIAAPPTLGEVTKPEADTAQLPTTQINLDATRIKISPAPEWTLCLDFGTAKSKAFAATGDEDEPKLEPLKLGEADGDLDKAVYEVASCVWIDDEGRLFFGSEAVNRHMLHGGARRALSSIKQKISLAHREDGAAALERFLDEEEDPTLTLSYADAITIYLAYLTDLATTALEKRSRTRLVRRRFTVPAWPKSQRHWAAEWIGVRLLRAQLLADTFHGQWRGGLSVARVKNAVREASKHDKKLGWMKADSLNSSRWELGTLEALAAASGRVWTDDKARQLMLVVDVGAGTTDFALFWVVQRDGEIRRAWPVQGGFDLELPQAGDLLDDCLVEEMMAKARLGIDGIGKEARLDLRRQGIRQAKEALFSEAEKVTRTLVNGQSVTLTHDEFVESQRVRQFAKAIADKVQELLDSIDRTWYSAAGKGITVVLTGGGCDLPMIRDLENQEWRLGDGTIRLRSAPRAPDFVARRFERDFVQDYPRLAVAMGGALSMQLDESQPLMEWKGGTGKPGGLDQYQTKGI